MARIPKGRVTAEAAKDAVAHQAAEQLVQKPVHQAAPARTPKPYAHEPKFGRNFDRVVELVFDESVDVQAEYAELEHALDVAEALTPQVVREQLNVVERRAFRAARLHVTAKLELERYEIDASVAIGAMRERAIAKLQVEKDEGKRSKQITDPDVRDACAVLFPDEWREVNNQLEKAKRATELLGKLAELWAGRRYSLGAMAGGSRN